MASASEVIRLTASASQGSSGRRCLDRQRVDALLQFIRQRGIDHAVLVDARLAAEGFRHDPDAEMALAIGPAPEWPACWWDSSITSSAAGAKLCRELCGDSLADRTQMRGRCHSVPHVRQGLLGLASITIIGSDEARFKILRQDPGEAFDGEEGGRDHSAMRMAGLPAPGPPQGADGPWARGQVLQLLHRSMCRSTTRPTITSPA